MSTSSDADLARAVAALTVWAVACLPPGAGGGTGRARGVGVLDPWGRAPAPLVLALARALRGAGVGLSWLRCGGPTQAEERLCRALRARAAAAWLVLDADDLMLVTRARTRPGAYAPDIVRLVRRTGVWLVGARRADARQTADGCLLTWAEKRPFVPVFCDC